MNHAEKTSSRRRIASLVRKEINQIRRDRRLAVALIVPPIAQILLFGFALDSTVSNLRLGVLDYSKTPVSREFVAQLSQSESFVVKRYYNSPRELGDAIGRGEIDDGVTIPYDFDRELQRGRPVTVQFLLNASNANTAAIAQGYAQGVIQNYNRVLIGSGLHAQFTQVAARPVSRKGQVVLREAFLFNPGLVSSWFIVTGTFGVLLILNGSLVASAAMIKEREAGTVEQLLMTPADGTEIVIAKLTPLFALLLLMVLLAMSLIRFVFHVPFRGNIFLVLAGAALCVLSGIGIGTFIATYAKSGQQARLVAFFVNPPLASLSGSLTPIEAMPHWLQPFTWVNPLRHFGLISRGVLVKQSGLAELWPNFLVLLIFTIVLVGLSVSRFRKQLG
ncbi:MAG TPA: ABC transporter permease [Bryobacteraceae bacterium]|jgi:ABC-2 type transport system permease protein